MVETLIHSEYDPLTGIETRYYVKPDGNVKIQKLQDVDYILEANKADYNNQSDWIHGRYKSDLYNKVATIPTTLLEVWAQEAGTTIFSKEFDNVLRNKLNSPEYRYLRTMKGRI